MTSYGKLFNNFDAWFVNHIKVPPTVIGITIKFSLYTQFDNYINRKTCSKESSHSWEWLYLYLMVLKYFNRDCTESSAVIEYQGIILGVDQSLYSSVYINNISINYFHVRLIN